MRRRFFTICLLLCALMLGGWGSVLAAALCPHAARAEAVASVPESMKMDDDHACCRMKMEDAGEHCSGQSHEAMPATEAESHKVDAQALALPVEPSCSHCISHNSLPTAPVKACERAQKRPDATRLAPRAVTQITPPAVSFVSSVSPTQGAPPGPLARKHLLLSVFLI
jgi:hypothetical protein